MSEQQSTDIVLQRPTTNGRDEWKAYWQAQGMPWRTEPEISEERQRYLTERRATKPDIERGIYPFRNENGGIRLTRADVEWLLATHESGGMRGPVDWNDMAQREREGADLRGANLAGLDLKGLPLAQLRGGLDISELPDFDYMEADRLGDLAALHLEEVDIRWAHLKAAIIRYAHLERANLAGTLLMNAKLSSAKMRGARIVQTDLRDANLAFADIRGVSLFEAHLEGAYLDNANLAGANLLGAYFNTATSLKNALLNDSQFGCVAVAGVRWGGIDLSVVKWAENARHPSAQAKAIMLGDELWAREKTWVGRPKGDEQELEQYKTAVRAYRQLATVLRAQGLNEDADRFAYRAQVCQRATLRLQGVRKWPAYLGSLFLWGVAGYGYKLSRIGVAYGAILLFFSVIYMFIGVHSHPGEPGIQSLWDSFLVSLSAIHGRTTFEQLGAWSPAAWVAAIESVFGIVIEGIFVAMLIQRFFAR